MGSYDGRDRRIIPDNLLLSSAQALPNNTNADSTNVIDMRGKGLLGNTPVFLYVDLSAHTIAGGKIFAIKIMHCDTVDGSYAEIFRKHFVATDTIGGRWLFALAFPERFVKINYETTDNLSAKTVTAFLTPNL